MKVLLDTCVWGGAVAALQQSGHDVVWAGSWARDPGDDEILRLAHAEGRILITLDKDFGELAIVQNRPHAGIVRLVRVAAAAQASVADAVLNRHGALLAQGAIVTVEPGRIRIREPERE